MDQEINRLIQFLARRDVKDLTPEYLHKTYGVSKADAMFVFGNDLTLTMEYAASYFQRGIAEKLVICGGIGHSTDRLRKRAAGHYGFTWEDVENLSEAAIYGEIAVRAYGIARQDILLDTESSNSGANAVNGLQKMREHQLPYRHIILIQDPIMQRRAVASLEQWIGTGHVISFAPFLPEVDKDLSFTEHTERLWDKERFLELLLGEIPRLRDDEHGYGPKGQAFIPHVEIPEEIESVFQKLEQVFADKNQRKLSE